MSGKPSHDYFNYPLINISDQNNWRSHVLNAMIPANSLKNLLITTSLGRCDLSGFRSMILKKYIYGLKNLKPYPKHSMTSKHQEKLLELNKYLGKIYIIWVVHWYIQNVSFNKQIGFLIMFLYFSSLHFSNLISALFNLCLFYSLPSVWSFQLRITL